MIVVPYPTLSPTDPIRKLDLTRDLNHVADLIELCFPIHLDPDGRTYVNEMRKAAHQYRLMGWLTNVSDLDPVRASGFVWEDTGRIIGNLSLIPLKREGRRVYLIANVAVHPDFRRRGIARKLTKHALAYLGRQRESQVWLQVRDDNQPALELYRSLGFKEQTARSTWRIRPVDLNNSLIPNQDGLSFRRRIRADWATQSVWLAETYPQLIRWNLPVNFRRFHPGIIQALKNFVESEHFRHWAVTLDGKCHGMITWQRTDGYANNLWLAFPTETEDFCLSWGLESACHRLGRRHPLSIDYPKGRFQEGFEKMGFMLFRTLVWMRCNL